MVQAPVELNSIVLNSVFIYLFRKNISKRIIKLYFFDFWQSLGHCVLSGTANWTKCALIASVPVRSISPLAISVLGNEWKANFSNDPEAMYGKRKKKKWLEEFNQCDRTSTAKKPVWIDLPLSLLGGICSFDKQMLLTFPSIGLPNGQCPYSIAEPFKLCLEFAF